MPSRYFNKRARNYKERSERGAWKLIRARELAAVLAYVPALKKTARILDLGCGAGFYLGHFAHRGFAEILGVDQSSEMIDVVRSLGLEGIRADIETFRTKKTVDLIVCAGALEFVSSPAKVFKNVAAMLDEEGIFILLYPPTSFLTLFYKAYHGVCGSPVKTFSRRSIEQLANSAGLEILSRKRVLPFATVLSLKRRANDPQRG